MLHTLAGVTVAPYMSDVPTQRQGQDLYIYVHTQPDVTTDTTKVACFTPKSGVTTVTWWETFIQCPLTAGVKYVTFMVRLVAHPCTGAQAHVCGVWVWACGGDGGMYRRAQR